MYSTCMWGCLEAPSQNLLACLEVLGCIRFLLSFSQRSNRQWEAKQHLQSLTRATKRLSNFVIEALSCNTMWPEIGQRSSHSPRIKKRPEITRLRIRTNELVILRLSAMDDDHDRAETPPPPPPPEPVESVESKGWGKHRFKLLFKVWCLSDWGFTSAPNSKRLMSHQSCEP